jgi:hypothetical protein
MSHVTWPNLLPLALRLRVAEELLLAGRPSDAYQNDSASMDVLNEFDLVAHSQMAVAGRSRRSDSDASSEGPAIDAYYARVSAALIGQAEPAACRSVLARELLNIIGRACRRPVCSTCSGSATRWCRWTQSSGAADARNMANTGLCVRRITETFRWAHLVAAQAYSAVGLKARAVPSLSTKHGQRNTQLELAIDAITEEGPRKVTGSRVVIAVFEPKTFSVLDYLSLPYVLLHECVAHAYCGINVSEQEAERSKNFHDGWMDCVAASLLDRAINTASQPTGAPVDFPTEVFKQMDTVRKLRFNVSRPARPLDTSKWLEGERAFHTLWHLFALAFGEQCDDWNRASTESRDAVIELSLRINGSKLDHGARHEFVQAILKVFSWTLPARRRTALLENIQVIDYINNYRVDNDALQFVRDILALAP